MNIRLCLAAALMACLLFAASAHAGPKVKFETTMGDFVVELDREKAPKTVSNFLNYVRKGFYDGTIFHRVISNFMIQGGGFTEGMQQKPTEAPVVNEAGNGLKNKKYTIAMARTSDPNSATAQFFINVVDNPSLDYKASTPEGYGYAVFGTVIRGQNVIDTIKGVPTGMRGQHRDVPLQPVIIKRAVISE